GDEELAADGHERVHLALAQQGLACGRRDVGRSGRVGSGACSAGHGGRRACAPVPGGPTARRPHRGAGGNACAGADRQRDAGARRVLDDDGERGAYLCPYRARAAVRLRPAAARPARCAPAAAQRAVGVRRVAAAGPGLPPGQLPLARRRAGALGRRGSLAPGATGAVEPVSVRRRPAVAGRRRPGARLPQRGRHPATLRGDDGAAGQCNRAAAGGRRAAVQCNRAAAGGRL
ncbi:MAG: hypothetical protein AVDCRST_MAG77-5304, partial [uncultured Chloroflexi bacterium]